MKSIKKHIKATGIIFFNLSLSKKTNNNPAKNKTSGILFPEYIMPTPRAHIAITVNMKLRFFLFLNIKTIKSIEKKEKFCIKPPAINSSPKNPVLE